MSSRDADRLFAHIRRLWLAFAILFIAFIGVAIIAATAQASEPSGRHGVASPASPHPAALAEPVPPRGLELDRAGDGRASRSEERKPLRARQWWQLRECESGNDYRAVSSSGRYRGAYQFDRPTWASYGPAGDPAAAPKPEQDNRAQLLYDARGAQPWPVCGRWLP